MKIFVDIDSVINTFSGYLNVLVPILNRCIENSIKLEARIYELKLKIPFWKATPTVIGPLQLTVDFLKLKATLTLFNSLISVLEWRKKNKLKSVTKELIKFLDNLATISLLTDKNKEIVFVFDNDNNQATYRHRLNPKYKKARGAKHNQYLYLRNMIYSRFKDKYECIVSRYYEGSDVIATKMNEHILSSNEDECAIITNDKSLLQLLIDKVCFAINFNNKGKVSKMDEHAFIEKYRRRITPYFEEKAFDKNNPNLIENKNNQTDIDKVNKKIIFLHNEVADIVPFVPILRDLDDYRLNSSVL